MFRSTSIERKKKYTYGDYLKTPDDKRYELINGKLLMEETLESVILKGFKLELKNIF